VDIFEALLNMADVFADLWPLDDTPRILMRVLLHYNMAAGIKTSKADRGKIMIEFCDTVLRENACRAVESEVPLSFRQAKERWTELVERLGPAAAAAVPANAKTSPSGLAGTTVRNTSQHQNQGHKGGVALRNRNCRYSTGGQTYSVCFKFNRGGCRRPSKGVGCDDSRGGLFAHVCNFFDSATSKFCLNQHPTDGNH